MASISSAHVDHRVMKNLIPDQTHDEQAMLIYHIEKVYEHNPANGTRIACTLAFCKPVSYVTYRVAPRIIKYAGHNAWATVGDFITAKGISYRSSIDAKRWNIQFLGSAPYFEVDKVGVRFHSNLKDVSPSIFDMEDMDFITLEEYIECTSRTCEECGSFIPFFDEKSKFHTCTDYFLTCSDCYCQINPAS